MITAQRQEILKLLERLSDLAPDVRFGQLIANLSYLAMGPTIEAIWDMQDEELMRDSTTHRGLVGPYRERGLIPQHADGALTGETGAGEQARRGRCTRAAGLAAHHGSGVGGPAPGARSSPTLSRHERALGHTAG